MRVLELVGEEPMSVTNVAQSLGMSKGAASRLLASMIDAGFIERDPARRHIVSVKVWSLGVRSLQHMRIADMARPLIYEAARSSGISLYLAVVRDSNAYLLEQVTAPHGVAMSVPLANVIPHYASAPGKAILAYAGSERTDAIFAQPVQAFTQHTITRRDVWDKGMTEIRGAADGRNGGRYREGTLRI